MFKRFFYTVRVQDYASKILMTDGCISLTTLHRWARFVLCLDNMHQTTWTMCTRLTQPSDPPRHPSIMQDETYVEPNVLEYPVATIATEEAPAPAPSDVEQPRHAVEACQAIAEMLEWLLNLRMMTKGTETYDVMQDCLRIIKGVIMDRNVYVRPRRRRRTDHA
ncbi:hypothetical protein GmHk_10G028119 [Glycine max]|nr:hypothetical protein GmHk_10G028119 [Glycine max]